MAPTQVFLSVKIPLQLKSNRGFHPRFNPNRYLELDFAPLEWRLSINTSNYPPKIGAFCTATRSNSFPSEKNNSSQSLDLFYAFLRNTVVLTATMIALCSRGNNLALAGPCNYYCFRKSPIKEEEILSHFELDTHFKDPELDALLASVFLILLSYAYYLVYDLALPSPPPSKIYSVQVAMREEGGRIRGQLEEIAIRPPPPTIILRRGRIRFRDTSSYRWMGLKQLHGVTEFLLANLESCIYGFASVHSKETHMLELVWKEQKRFYVERSILDAFEDEISFLKRLFVACFNFIVGRKTCIVAETTQQKHNNGYIVVTILVCTNAPLELSIMNNGEDLKKNLQTLNSFTQHRSEVDVLWAPELVSRWLTLEELQEKCPHFIPL
ncbi:unnamed protein product [Cuscuta epithymum]|uniref:Uncharacterized protein n=1 Tax=Cuscuta epithymum TaxID=186058 RepID=A0AAV0BWJ7_9ASTE|nr:unnamed protein product [Cuscuta epithymum]